MFFTYYVLRSLGEIKWIYFGKKVGLFLSLGEIKWLYFGKKVGLFRKESGFISIICTYVHLYMGDAHTISNIGGTGMCGGVYEVPGEWPAQYIPKCAFRSSETRLSTPETRFSNPGDALFRPPKTHFSTARGALPDPPRRARSFKCWLWKHQILTSFAVFLYGKYIKEKTITDV